MAVITISNTGGNWNSTGTWVGGVIPTSSDSIAATATSGQLTLNVAAAIQFADLSLYANILTLNNVLSINTVGATTTFSASMTFAGTPGTGTITFNANHTIIQNNTSQIPTLTFGPGTRTLNTNMYCTNFNSTNTSNTTNGNKVFIYGSYSTSSGRIAGTTEFTLAGTGTLTFGAISNQIGIFVIDTTGTYTCANNVAIGPGGTFRYVKGTINFTNSWIGNRLIQLNPAAASTLTITLPTTGQTFSYWIYVTDSSLTDRTINWTNLGTDINIDTLYFSNNSTSGYSRFKFLTPGGRNLNISKLYFNNDDSPQITFQALRTIVIGEIYLNATQLNVVSTYPAIIQSDTASSPTYINLTGGTQSLCSYFGFQDIDASLGNTIRVFSPMILTRTSNITSITNTIPGSGGASNYTFIS